MTSIFKGSGGYDVAYRIDGNNIYIGSGGYDVAYRIDGNNIYKGSGGYDVAFRIDGNRILIGSGGYDVAFRIDGNRILIGSGGYDVAYRIGYDGDPPVKPQTPNNDEKSGCLGVIFKFIGFCLRLFRTWSGRVGMLLGVIAAIAMASSAKDFMNALFLGVFIGLLLLFIGGALGTLVGFIFRKSSKTAKFGGLIGAGALALTGVILCLIEHMRGKDIIMLACAGIVVGWVLGTIIGAIVGAIRKKK